MIVWRSDEGYLLQVRDDLPEDRRFLIPHGEVLRVDFLPDSGGFRLVPL